jgi:predicted dehydrogenase
MATDMLSAVIIGCGAIAGGYDEATDGDSVLTHACGYRAHGAIRIAGCVEPEEQRRLAFMERWNVPTGFSSLEQCLDSGLDFEIASICTPTASHGPLLRMLSDHGVKAMFCEKPITPSLTETSDLVAGLEAAGTMLAVNYLRRWDPSMDTLCDELSSGKWGGVQEVVAFYNKGILHTGSHMIDLLQLLLGPLALDKVLHQREDFSATDPTVDAALRTKQGVPVYLIGDDSQRYARFELSIACEGGVVEIEDSGFRIRRRAVGPHRYFPRVQHLDEGTTEATGLPRAMANAVDNLYAAVTCGEPLRSDGQNAIAAHTLCDEILRSSRA